MRTLLRILLVLGVLFVGAVILFAVAFRDRRPSIYFAAERGDTNALAQYLGLGSNVNDAVVCYVYGHRTASLLHIAAWSGQPNAVDFILRKGGDPNLRDSSGDTALQCVIGRGEAGVRVLRMLLRAGADPNLRSSGSGWTPLMHAAVLGSAEDVRILLAAGADVNAADTHGATPLHYADNVEVTQRLIAAGANRNASFTYVTPADRDHPAPVTNIVTPADSALSNHRLAVLALLTNDPPQTKR